LADAPEKIKRHRIGNCLKADPACGKGLAVDLGLCVGAKR
jgi:hypothetical protein